MMMIHSSLDHHQSFESQLRSGCSKGVFDSGTWRLWAALRCDSTWICKNGKISLMLLTEEILCLKVGTDNSSINDWLGFARNRYE